MFDPLHQWLGIPADQQPPHHYRLLGLEKFESDVGVIHSAADKQLAFLHHLTNGEHAAAAESLSNQVSAARLCLVSPEKKARYDAELRSLAVAPETLPPLGKMASPSPESFAPAETFVQSPVEPTPTLRVRKPGRSRQRSLLSYWHYSAMLCVVLMLLVLVGLKRGVISLHRDRMEWLGVNYESTVPVEEIVIVDSPVDPAAEQNDVAATTPVVPTSPPTEPSPVAMESAPSPRIALEPISPELAAPTPAASTPDSTASTSLLPKDDSLIDLMHPSVAIPNPKPTVLLAPATTPGTRTPMPTGDMLEKRMSLVSELYKERYTAAKTAGERVELATQMLLDGEQTTDDPVGRFALWKVAREIFAREGRFDLAIPIVDRFGQSYTGVPVGRMKAESLTASAEAISGIEIAKYVAAAVDLIDDLTREKDFDTAIKLADFTTARFANRVPRNRRTELADAAERARNGAARYKEYVIAGQTLNTDPADELANELVGAYLALVREDWQRGLPRIAMGTPSPLADAAKAELAVGSRRDADSSIAVADRWYELADTLTDDPTGRDAVRRHALFWYATAQASATGLVRKKIDLKVNELVQAYPDVISNATISTGGDTVAIAGVQILDRQTRTGGGSRRDVAAVDGRRLIVGMGPRPDGLGEAEAGLELRGVKQVVVTGSASHKEMVTVDAFSKTGFVIDYHTPSGYSRRVFLGLGLAPGREFAATPLWGTAGKPDVVTDIGRSDSYTIDLNRFAPADWDGRCWFAVLMHNAGTDRRLEATLSW